MNRRSQRGFTLMEVLIATVLLGSAFVAVLSLMSQSLRNIDRMTPHEIAMRHAREVMTEELVREELVPEHNAGRFPDGFRWDVEILPYETVTVAGKPSLPQLQVARPQSDQPIPQGTPALFLIRVQIAWGDDPQKTRTYEVETTQWAKWPMVKPS